MEELGYWLALHRAPGLGPVLFRELLGRYGSPRDALQAAPEALRHRLTPAGLRSLTAPDWAAIEADLEWGMLPGHALLTWRDARYPGLLSQLADAPPVLYVQGEPRLLSVPQLAIVGSRNPTPAGREMAREFARSLALAGLGITSGLALGVDGASHEGALCCGGVTIAVAGTGLDRVYPARHRELAHRIAAHGAIVSELPLGAPPLPGNFPRRNRLISGLSVGTLVVEAALHSGSLITARAALEQGREVFAIPGSIHNPLARGCHSLIREGAKLVETAQDVLEELGPLVQLAAMPREGTTREMSPGELDAEYSRILECLSFDPTSVDVLVERSGLTPEEVSSMLLILELRGYVASLSGGLYTRATQRA